MQAGTVDTMAHELPRHVIDSASHTVHSMGIPALEHLSWAVREQRVSDGYRRLLQAIRDESRVSSSD